MLFSQGNWLDRIHCTFAVVTVAVWIFFEEFDCFVFDVYNTLLKLAETLPEVVLFARL